MAKSYNGGIGIATGFNLQDPQPIDDRLVVGLLADLISNAALPNPYPGMVVSVASEGYDLYRWNGTDRTQSSNWILVGSGAGGSLPNGGTEDQLLVKNTATNGDADWETVPAIGFSSNHVSRLIALVYENGVASLSVSPTSFEKNLTAGTNLTFTYSTTANDDTVQAVTWNGTNVPTVLSPNGSETFTAQSDSLGKNYNVTFLNADGITTRTDSNPRTSVAYNPQWYGASSTADFDSSSYSNLNSNFTKFVSGSPAKTAAFTATNEYVYFLSTKSNATIYDGNNFNNTSDFTKTTVSVTYEDGTALTLYQYRTNLPKTLSAFTYRIA